MSTNEYHTVELAEKCDEWLLISTQDLEPYRVSISLLLAGDAFTN